MGKAGTGYDARMDTVAQEPSGQPAEQPAEQPAGQPAGQPSEEPDGSGRPGEPVRPEVMARLAARQKELFDSMAQAADRLAETVEFSAKVHDEMGDALPGAAEHAERDRRLAKAERRSAEALRKHELPPDDARETIREV